MAVQAQHPSNVLLGVDCSIQPQLGGGGGGGGFNDHQSHMLFSNGVTNTRKRGKEGSVTAASNDGVSSGNVIPNPFTLQQQPHHLQLIDISELHRNHQSHQPAVVSTGLRLSFNDQTQNQQSLARDSTNSVSSPVSSDFLTEHIKRQRDEIDQLILAQGDQLRLTLAEKRQRHYWALLRAAEEVVARRLREKEAEVEKAARHNVELEARAAQLAVEAQLWQARARAQEVAAGSLQTQLQQAIISGGQDRTLPMDGGGSEVEDAESVYVDPDRVVVVEALGPSCRACRRRAATVVVLPCRHLSLCTACDGVAGACPVCFTARESSVEVYFP